MTLGGSPAEREWPQPDPCRIASDPCKLDKGSPDSAIYRPARARCACRQLRCAIAPCTRRL